MILGSPPLGQYHSSRILSDVCSRRTRSMSILPLVLVANLGSKLASGEFFETLEVLANVTARLQITQVAPRYACYNSTHRPPPHSKRSMPDMWVDRFIRNPLWTTLVGALVAAMVVTLFVFVRSGEAAPQTADEQTPYASVSPKSPMIVGGTAVTNGTYPFMAHVTLYRNGMPDASCAGSLIDQDSVLTAAHCLKNTTGAVVVVGRTDLRKKNRGQEIEASRPFIHPRYLGSGYDAGVLKLRRPVKGIKPIKLASSNQNNLETPGRKLTVAGWGLMGFNGTVSNRLRQAQVPVVPDRRAEKSYDALLEPSGYVPPIMIAAGNNKANACVGDSGGPLFDSGSRTLVGIVSGGYYKCGTARYPGVYTEVNNPDIRNFILAAAKR
jgi:trypsin